MKKAPKKDKMKCVGWLPICTKSAHDGEAGMEWPVAYGWTLEQAMNKAADYQPFREFRYVPVYAKQSDLRGKK